MIYFNVCVKWTSSFNLIPYADFMAVLICGQSQLIVLFIDLLLSGVLTLSKSWLTFSSCFYNKNIDFIQ